MGRDVTEADGCALLCRIAAWKARGQAREAEGTAASLAEALRCYDEALALLRADPAALAAVRLEHGIVWMNRGNALQKIGTPAKLAEAVRAYDEAIAILPVGDGDVAQNALGAAWLNRGRALQSLGGAGHLAEALRSQERAVALLRPLDQGGDCYFQLNLAGACLNLATLLAARGRLVEAADAIDEGLLVARRKGPGAAALRPVVARLFHLGAQLCAVNQPQFLVEFVRENLDPADDASLAAAREALGRARARLGRPRVLQVDDPAAHRQLAVWRELAEFDPASVAPNH
jgi:tetratricopeptide (TPR) repeat protein